MLFSSEVTMADQKIIWGGVAVVVASVYVFISLGGVSDESATLAIDTQNNDDNKPLTDSGTRVQPIERLNRSLEQKGVAYIDMNGNTGYRATDEMHRDSNPQNEGSRVVRHVGEKLNPKTYVGEGAPELIALGERLDPEKVYRDSGAKHLQLLGERITDVETYIAEGSATYRNIGQRIPPSEVR